MVFSFFLLFFVSLRVFLTQANDSLFFIRDGERRIMNLDQIFSLSDLSYEFSANSLPFWVRFQNVLSANFTQKNLPIDSEALQISQKGETFYALLANQRLISFTVSSYGIEIKQEDVTDLKEKLKLEIYCDSFIFTETQSILVISCIDTKSSSPSEKFKLVTFDTKAKNMEIRNIVLIPGQGNTLPEDMGPLNILNLNMGKKTTNYFIVWSPRVVFESGAALGPLQIWRILDFNQFEKLTSVFPDDTSGLLKVFSSGTSFYLLNTQKTLSRYYLSVPSEKTEKRDSLFIYDLNILAIIRSSSGNSQTVFFIDEMSVILEVLWTDSKEFSVVNSFQNSYSSISLFKMTDNLIFAIGSQSHKLSVYLRYPETASPNDLVYPIYEINFGSYLFSDEARLEEEDLIAGLLFYSLNDVDYLLVLDKNKGKLYTIVRSSLEIDCLSLSSEGKGCRTLNSPSQIEKMAVEVQMKSMKEAKGSRSKSLEINILSLSDLSFVSVVDQSEEIELELVSTFVHNFLLRSLFFGETPTGVDSNYGKARLVIEDSFIEKITNMTSKTLKVFKDGALVTESTSGVWKFQILDTQHYQPSSELNISLSDIDFSLVVFKNVEDAISNQILCKTPLSSAKLTLELLE